MLSKSSTNSVLAYLRSVNSDFGITDKVADECYIQYPVLLTGSGVHLSVQASGGHHSAPRAYRGPHTQVEVVIRLSREEITQLCPEMDEFFSDIIEATEGGDFDYPLYSYLPVTVLDAFVHASGGYDFEGMGMFPMTEEFAQRMRDLRDPLKN